MPFNEKSCPLTEKISRYVGGGVGPTANLHECIGEKPRIDLEALAYYLFYRFVPPPLCLWEGVRQIPPGFESNDGGSIVPIGIQIAPPLRVDMHEAVELFNREMRKVPDLDGPVAILLSGGLDSTAVLAAMCEAGKPPDRAFCVGFSDSREFEQAEIAAKYFGVPLSRLVISDREYLEQISVLPGLFRSVPPGGIDVPRLAYALNRIADEGYKSVATGSTADESGGGYKKWINYHTTDDFPSAFVGQNTFGVDGLLSFATHLEVRAFVGSLKRQVKELLKIIEIGDNKLNNSQRGRLMDYLYRLPGYDRRMIEEMSYSLGLVHWSPFDTDSVFSLNTRLPDRMSENRLGVDKPLLRMWAKGRIPQEIRNTMKGATFGNDGLWVSPEYKQRVMNEIADGPLAQLELFKEDRVRYLLDGNDPGKNSFFVRVLILGAYLRQFENVDFGEVEKITGVIELKAMDLFAEMMTFLGLIESLGVNDISEKQLARLRMNLRNPTTSLARIFGDNNLAVSLMAKSLSRAAGRRLSLPVLNDHALRRIWSRCVKSDVNDIGRITGDSVHPQNDPYFGVNSIETIRRYIRHELNTTGNMEQDRCGIPVLDFVEALLLGPICAEVAISYNTSEDYIRDRFTPLKFGAINYHLKTQRLTNTNDAFHPGALVVALNNLCQIIERDYDRMEGRLSYDAKYHAAVGLEAMRQNLDDKLSCSQGGKYDGLDWSVYLAFCETIDIFKIMVDKKVLGYTTGEYGHEEIVREWVEALDKGALISPLISWFGLAQLNVQFSTPIDVPESRHVILICGWADRERRLVRIYDPGSYAEEYLVVEMNNLIGILHNQQYAIARVAIDGVTIVPDWDNEELWKQRSGRITYIESNYTRWQGDDYHNDNWQVI